MSKPEKPPVAVNWRREFIKRIQSLSHRHRLHKVFSDFCEVAAIALSNQVDYIHREDREKRYEAISKDYEKAELEVFAEMLGCVAMALEFELQDFLGSCFMELELGNHWKGQFFTPYSISKMMADITFDSLTKESIEEKGGFITVNEPACGAGAMIIAAAEHFLEHGLDYQKTMHVTAQDLDVTACHMTYIQLSLLNVPAYVLRGNSLKVEVDDWWVTPAHVIGGWESKLKARREKSE